jgi:hypothetical protein
MDHAPSAAFLAPVFVACEIAQLVYAERFLGVKQVQAGLDPRALGPSEPIALLWVVLICAQNVWLLWLLREGATRLHAACLLLVSLCGFALRGSCALRWVLGVLTFEGALRLGLMVSMFGAAWRGL